VSIRTWWKGRVQPWWDGLTLVFPCSGCNGFEYGLARLAVHEERSRVTGTHDLQEQRYRLRQRDRAARQLRGQARRAARRSR
jgi:hypothetical protein